MRIIKLVISIAIFAVDCLRRLVAFVLGRKPDPTLVIIYYHSVKDDQRLAFGHQMDAVVALTEPISIHRWPPLEPGRRYSAITFDDGFENIITNALPALQKRGISATVFLTVDYLGQSAGWWPQGAPERNEVIATAEKWRQLPSDLISIGSHSLSHPYLTALDEIEAKRELSESRLRLQALFDSGIEGFSFPYGDFNDDLVSWCRGAGYERIFTSLPADALKNGGSFIYGRTGVEPTDSALEFRLKILGAYRWLPLAISLKRKILSFPVIRQIRGRRKSAAEQSGK